VARDLADIAAPAHTALVTQECQRGVIGDLSRLPALAGAAAQGMTKNVAALAAAARAAGVAVLHGTAQRRADGRGASHNSRLFAAMAKLPPLLPGSPDVEIVPEIGCADSDIVVPRLHGLSPMSGTELDPILRNLGVSTIVVVGVSVNVAVTNCAFDAVNLGYQVVVPADAVTGWPADYVEAVIRHTLSLIATVTSTEELLAAWQGISQTG
jgi:nicotinamidase-related amidase